MVTLAVDAMGGDDAPREIVKGTVDAAGQIADTQYLLVGREAAIEAELSQLGPVRERLSKLLEGSEKGHREIRRRIKVLPMGTRRVNREVFETLSFALMNRRRLRIRHLRRQTGEETDRVVSPQRLVHYRDNWYLDAWCHTRRDIRIFAVDAIRAAQALEDPARDVDDARLDEVLRAGYGIFAGRETGPANHGCQYDGGAAFHGASSERK